MEIITRKEAQSKGLTHYFTGKPCKHGHVAKRFRSGPCTECARTIHKTVNSKEYHAAYWPQYYAKNKKARYEKSKEWAANNQEKKKVAGRRGYLVSISTPEKKACLLAKCCKWKRANKNRVNYASALRRKGVVDRTPSWADLEAIKFFYDCCPADCHVDHIIPLHGKYISGLHIAENLQWLPAKQNMAKGNGFGA